MEPSIEFIYKITTPGKQETLRFLVAGSNNPRGELTVSQTGKPPQLYRVSLGDTQRLLRGGHQHFSSLLDVLRKLRADFKKEDTIPLNLEIPDSLPESL